MLESLCHRGPDDSGEHREETPRGTLWLGHKRLAILDISHAGHQPMLYGQGRFVITFNGEIYNFWEIRRELEGAGYSFSTRTDTEVILASWDRWGPASLGRFIGMFAFALWDRDEERLWLARDRLGEKPLYYAAQPGLFLFASEVRSLLASGVVERRIDSDGLDSYLSFGSVCQPYTIVKNVRSLGAGQLLGLHENRPEIRTYWSLGDIEKAQEPKVRIEQMRDLLIDSVKLCMVSDAPVGLLLSGGVDSTTVLAMLAGEGFDNLSTFTVVFDENPAFSEDRWAADAAEHFRTRHTRIPVSMKEARELLPKAVESMDQPSIDGAQTFIVSGAIAHSGVKVALSGLGSDELFFGYGLHRHYGRLLALSRLRPLRMALFLLAGMSRLRPLSGRFTPAFARARKLLDLYTEGSREAVAYLAWQSIFSHGEINRLRGEMRPTPARFIQVSFGADPLATLSRLDLTNHMKNTLLRDADQMSMAHSLELRVPFLDYRLVESVASLPTSLRVGDGKYKQLLVNSVNHPAVSEAAGRPKSGFELPLDSWLRNGFRLGEIRPDLLGLDRKEISSMMRRFRLGEKCTRYWSLLVLSRWLEKMGMAS
jgi:asparagine synthase (glutamine-hydrolysing)